MSNPPHDPKKFSRLRRIQQISENHCGPAVVQMLLENVGVEPKKASKNVVSLFMPLIRKYRRGEKTK